MCAEISNEKIGIYYRYEYRDAFHLAEMQNPIQSLCLKFYPLSFAGSERVIDANVTLIASGENLL